MSTDMFPQGFIDYMLEQENNMTDHGDNYKRMTDDDGKEVGQLGPKCGHHCGVLTVGAAHSHLRHCKCAECHNEFQPDLPTNFTSELGGVNPRGIV